ncbi:MAG: L,D-transpeptidase [Anaerolineae bacterium]|jgi:lipoprotein-anchoring transpeptidase ErfK/SrfK|nr:L,D-transpeptidase [Anaerolineae bacterium]
MLISRRKLLRMTGSVAAAMAALPLTNLTHLFAHKIDLEIEVEPGPEAPPAPLGRVANWQVQIRAAPKVSAKVVRVAKRDEVLRLYEQVAGDAEMAHNNIWYMTDDGYAYSSWIQPVNAIKNPPEPDRAAEKFWGEITVPFSDARVSPDPQARRLMRLYYTGVFRVIGAAQDANGEWWYRLQDGVTFSPGPYVPAAHVRRFDPSELTPLSPGVENKRIVIDLARQMMTAYEGDTPLVTSRTATGYGPFQTPKGSYRIIRKRTTSRMIGGAGADAYDLPGVPFPSYFTASAIAIHGAYWHNDFGRRRSHGCVNVPAPVALWVWRWTTPELPYEAVEVRTQDSSATPVIVM